MTENTVCKNIKSEYTTSVKISQCYLLLPVATNHLM